LHRDRESAQIELRWTSASSSPGSCKRRGRGSSSSACWCSPSTCCLALAGFRALQVALAVIDPETLSQLFVVKVPFTIALIKGIQSARHAERLRRELEGVFG
jgi:hypothetical protein